MVNGSLNNWGPVCSDISQGFCIKSSAHVAFVKDLNIGGMIEKSADDMCDCQ